MWFRRTWRVISLSLSLIVGQLKFIDTSQFTPQGLYGLVKALADDEFRYLRGSCTSNHFGLIRRNCVYPYDNMDSFDRFDETEQPSQEYVGLRPKCYAFLCTGKGSNNVL